MAFSTETNLRMLQLVEAMARQMGLLPPLPEDHPAVPTVTKSIGTVGRDYSTITAWEADLDNSGIYASGDTARGEGYDDSAFDEGVTINGGGTVGLANRILTAAAGEQGDGTAGTGFRIVGSVARVIGCLVGPSVISLLEIDWNGFANGSSFGINGTATGNTISARQLLLHGVVRAGATRGINASTGDCNALDCFVCNMAATGANLMYGIDASHGTSTPVDVGNNTVHDIRSDSGTVNCIRGSNVANASYKNNVATDPSTSGTGLCFSGPGGTSPTATNASSDSTAPSPIATEPVVSAVEFVSNAAPYDLHLAAGAECNDAGTDLGTTPTGVNISMPTAGYASGYDRNADPDGRATPNWAVGADEPADVGGFGGISQVLGGGIIAA